MDERQDVTVPMPQSLVEQITDELEYGDSRAGWIREACRQRLEAEAEASEGNPRTPTPETASA